MTALGAIRWPLFVAALVLAVLALGVEIGSSFLPQSSVSGAAMQTVRSEASAQLEEADDLEQDEREEMLEEMEAEARRKPEKPPGRGVPSLGFIDGLLVFSLAMIGLSQVIGDRIQGRLQGVISLIASILLIIAAFFFALAVFIKLMIMVALFMATPFGTLAYLALYGFFNRGGAAAALGAGLTLKLASLVCLVLAQQGFLKLKWLLFLYATSLVGTLLVSFLHALVPIVLVSITDAIAAIIVAILAIVWGLIVLVGAIVGIVRAVF